MAKIMLVEDDTNLSEIYQARLTAEGYDIVSAHDGEEALAIAAKEKPDLIVSDVMMPKISGFEMLDILRNTEGLKETKVIMLTALGQAEDKTRAESLAADRYLVKSQVTLEDIVKAAQELLEGATAPAGAPTPAATPTQTAAPAPVPVATPVAVAAAPVAIEPAPVATPVATAPAPTPVPVTAPPITPAPVAVPAPTPAPTPITPAPVAPPVTAPAVAQPTPTPAVEPTPVAAPAPEPMPAPVPVATPPLVQSAPVAPTPSEPAAPAADPVTSADDKLVADAVNDLMKDVPGNAAPTMPTPTPAVEPPAPAEPESTPEPTPDTDREVLNDGPTNDNVSIAHKKVIRPITDGSVPEKPSLESLLADEERKNPGSTSTPTENESQVANKPVTNVPHQPGHIITPSAAESMNNGSGIDPNSIAL
jgi:CheY-like chemotaxis protein